MKTTNATDLRKNLKSNLDMVSNNKETVIIHRPGQEDVVMLTLSEFSSWAETNYLLSTENNAKRLLNSLNDVSKGNTQKLKIDDLWK